MSAADIALFGLMGGVAGGIIFYVADDAIKKLVSDKVGVVFLGIFTGIGAGVLVGSRFKMVGVGVDEIRRML